MPLDAEHAREPGEHRVARRIGGREGEPDDAFGDRRLQLGRRPVADDPSVVQDHDPVGDVVGLVEVVGREQHRPALGGEPAHVLPERAPRLDVHRDGRLVEEHEVGVAGDREREPDPLRLAARQGLRAAVDERGEAGPLEDGVAGRGRRVQRAGEVHELADPRAGRQPRGLEHRPDAARPDRVVRGHAQRGGPSARRLEQPEHDADRGGLAGAVGPEQGDGLAGLDGDADVVEGAGVAEAPADAVEVDRGRAGLEGDGRGRRGRHGPSIERPRRRAKSRSSRSHRDSRHPGAGMDRA